MGGLCLYPYEYSELLFVLSYLNSKVAEMQLNVINPTMSFPPGTINSLGCKDDIRFKPSICELTSDCINLAMDNWNTAELSWDYARNPLV